MEEEEEERGMNLSAKYLYHRVQSNYYRVFYTKMILANENN